MRNVLVCVVCVGVGLIWGDALPEIGMVVVFLGVLVTGVFPVMLAAAMKASDQETQMESGFLLEVVVLGSFVMGIGSGLFACESKERAVCVMIMGAVPLLVCAVFRVGYLFWTKGKEG